MKRLPFGSGWALPWLPEDRGLGWTNWASTDSVLVLELIDSSSARDCLWTIGTAPLSNTLIRPLPAEVASCWKAVAAPLVSLTVEFLPPSRLITWPVFVFSSYIAQVLRAEISVRPLESSSIEFRW